jgi:hypothetical protein
MYKPAVAFFGFNRPDCSKIVFEEIRRYRPERLLLVADGPRYDVPTDKDRCEAVRNIMKSVDWKCDVKMDFSEKNLGCKRRMSSGIDWVFSQVEEAIILEDDCVPSADFFWFCSEMLVRYRDNPSIMHIGGSNFQAGRVRGDGSYYFSRFCHIWGWASWRRAWQHYDVAMSSWPEAKLKNWISTVHQTRIEHEYWTCRFDEIYSGKIDTWDFQWAFAFWRNQGLAVLPNVNLVRNIGIGRPDATHTKGPDASMEVLTGTLGEIRHPSKIAVDQEADRFTFDEHCGGNAMRRERRLITRLRRKLGKVKRMILTDS